MASENESMNGFYINTSRSGEKISYGRFVVLKWITLYSDSTPPPPDQWICDEE